MWYYIFFVIGTACIFSASLVDHVASSRKDKARDLAADDAEKKRRESAEKDKQDILEAVSAARATEAAYQRRIAALEMAKETGQTGEAGTHNFPSVDQNLDRALERLPDDLKHALDTERGRLDRETAMVRDAARWNARIRPEIERWIDAIVSTIQDADKRGLIQASQMRTEKLPAEIVLTYLQSSMPVSVQLVHAELSGTVWDVKILLGRYEPDDGKGSPEIQGPVVDIEWRAPLGNSGFTSFHFVPKDGTVELMTAEQLFTHVPELRKKYQGAELVANVALEMLTVARLQSVSR